MDNISPQHYSRYELQPLDLITKNRLDFCRGNVVKYLLRHDSKNNLEDIKKAYVYFMQYVYQEYGKQGINAILSTEWNVTNINLE